MSKMRVLPTGWDCEGCEERGEGAVTIWAFCLRTSAGVRIRQETNSPVEEARECVIGVGREVWTKRALVAS